MVVDGSITWLQVRINSVSGNSAASYHFTHHIVRSTAMIEAYVSNTYLMQSLYCVYIRCVRFVLALVCVSACACSGKSVITPQVTRKIVHAMNECNE